MKKFKALNYIELTLVMLIIGIVFIVGMQIIKPQKISQTVPFNATWDNLMKANEELVYLNEHSEAPSDGRCGEETERKGLPADYCNQLADLVATSYEYCNPPQNSSKNPYLTFVNGIKIEFPKNIGWDDYMCSDAENTSIIITVETGSNRGGDIVQGKLAVYKDGLVRPIDNDNNNKRIKKINLNEYLKFRVLSKNTGEILPVTQKGVSFEDAVCYMGVNAKYGINTCRNGVEQNTELCPYPMSCKIDIVMPKMTASF